MKKYMWAFKMSAQNQLAYRMNFFLGRLRQMIVFVLLVSVWLTLSEKTGGFADYSQKDLLRYVTGAYILRSIIFGSQSRKIAEEIYDGTFSQYLIKPLNHMFFFYARELAERLLLFGMTLLELLVFSIFFPIALPIPSSGALIAAVLFSVILGHALYFLMSYGINLLAFWTRQAMGPRFLFEWFLEFASGAYFPLNILQVGFLTVLQILPFLYIIFAPLSIAGGVSRDQAIFGLLMMQGVFLVLAAAMVRHIWKRGLLRYNAEGL